MVTSINAGEARPADVWRCAALRSIVRAIWPASGPGPIGAPGSQV
jgi:hypothetical protein